MENLETAQKEKPYKRKGTQKVPIQRGQFYDADKSRLSTTVSVSPEVAFAFFRDFQNLPLFMKDLKSIEVLSETRSRWVVEVRGITAEWEAEITDERTGEMIAWQSVKGSEIETSGSIWFTPAPEILGTIISLSLKYKIPGGKLTELLTMFTDEDPTSLAFTNLRRLKCFLETDEIATIDGQTSGREDEAELIVQK